MTDSKTINEGQSLQFFVSATDEDNDPLTFSAENLPNGATFSTQDNQFSWKPTFFQSNVYTGIKFKVSDGKGGEDFETIQITVKDVPDQDSDGSPDSVDCNVKEPSIKQCGGCAFCSTNDGNGECDISPPKPIVCPSSTRCGEFGCLTTEIKTFTSPQTSTCVITDSVGTYTTCLTSGSCVFEQTCKDHLTDSDGVPDHDDKCPGTPTGKTVANGAVNLKDGCEFPLNFGGFDDPSTTKLDLVENLLAVSHFTVGKKDLGLIEELPKAKNPISEVLKKVGWEKE